MQKEDYLSATKLFKIDIAIFLKLVGQVFITLKIMIHCMKLVPSTSFQVGPTYGASTLQGYLRTKGIQVSKATIHEVQKKANPIAFKQRKHDLLDKRNPIPYYAPYFGYRGHIDQNEKLVRYGVVHVVLRDGHSGFIENWITLPSKNPIRLYSKFFR